MIILVKFPSYLLDLFNMCILVFSFRKFSWDIVLSILFNWFISIFRGSYYPDCFSSLALFYFHHCTFNPFCFCASFSLSWLLLWLSPRFLSKIYLDLFSCGALWFNLWFRDGFAFFFHIFLMLNLFFLKCVPFCCCPFLPLIFEFVTQGSFHTSRCLLENI